MHNIEQYLSEVLEIPKESIDYCNSFYNKKSVKKGEYLLQEGDVCEHTFFVEKGLLRMFSIDKNGKEHIIQFAPESWLISDRSSLFFGEKSKYYIETVEHSEVLFLTSDFFKI